MLSVFNRTFFQDILILGVVTVFIVAALVAHTLLPWVAIASAFVCGIVMGRFILRNKWNTLVKEGYSAKVMYFWLIIACAICSQLGWVALLI